jgi:hypothetical protein
VNNATATGTYGSGGGAYISAAGSLSLTDADINGTEIAGTSAYGGGLYISTSTTQPTTITGLTVNNAKATGEYSYGGGAYIRTVGSLSLADTDISVTETAGTLAYGGGALIYGSGTLTISNYTSENTRATGTGAGTSGGSLSIDWNGTVSIRNSAITNSRTKYSGATTNVSGGGGISITGNCTAAFSNIVFRDVQAQGAGSFILGGAVFFNGNNFGSVHLTMTGCSITDAAASRGGGAIAGVDPSSCTLSGVSFNNCAALQGSLLYGNSYTNISGAPAYTVRPGCSVNGTVITQSNWSSVLSPSMVYLVNGSTIGYAP